MGEAPTPRGQSDAEFLAHIVRKLGHDLLRYLPAVGVPAVASALYVMIFTRVFDPVDFGRYSLVFATSTLLTVLLSGWITQSVLRYQPRHAVAGELGGFRAALGTLVVAASAVTSAVFAVAYALARDDLGDYAGYYWPGAVLVVAGMNYLVLRTTLQAQLRSGLVSTYDVLFALGRLGAALVFVFLVARSAVGLILGPAVAYAALVLAMVARARPDGRRTGPARALARDFARYGVPMVGWMIGVKILELSDRYIIEHFRGAAEVGIYSASYNLVAMGVWLVASPMLMAAYPLVMNAWEAGASDRISRVVSAFSRYYLLAAVPVVAFAGICARDIVTLFVGEAFHEGARVVPVVLVGLLWWNFGFYGDQGLKLAERTGLLSLLVSVCVVANVGMNLYLVPRTGYMGAAWSTLAAATLYPVLVYAACRRSVRWEIPWGSLARILFAGLAAGLTVRLAGSVLGGAAVAARLALLAVAFIAVYALVLRATGELHAGERRWLRSLWKRTE